MSAHDDLRRLAKLAREVADRVPERPISGSPRDKETKALRRTAGGGGRTRADVLHRLNAEMQMMLGHLTLVAGGGADALEIASQRAMEVNGPALAFVVRPALELAGQIAWLLAGNIDGESRSRATSFGCWQTSEQSASCSGTSGPIKTSSTEQ